MFIFSSNIGPGSGSGNWRDKLGRLAPLLIFLLFMLGFKNSLYILALIAIFFVIYKLKNKFSREIAPGVIDGDKFMNPSNLKAGRYAIGIIIAAALIILFIASIKIVGAGEIGVYSLFGKVRNESLMSGFHLVNPLAKITSLSIRTEEYTMSRVATEGRRPGDDAIPALTREGLNLTLDITVLYHLKADKAADLYRELGVNFEEKIIRPEIRSVIREVIALYDAKDIYSEKREEATKEILKRVSGKLEPRGIEVEDVLVRDVTLPANLAQAIQEKLQADQEQQKYDFILKKEQKEAERKRIEAAGQRDSQKIINESLSTNYLYYQYINTLKDRQGTIYVPTNPATGMPQFKELGK